MTSPMTLSEFIKAYPISAELFKTENCAPQQIITQLMNRYTDTVNPGSGSRHDYTSEVIRYLVAHRLVALAMEDFSGKKASLSSDHYHIIKMQTRNFMPESITFVMVGYNIVVFVPPRVRKELNQKREGHGGNV